MRRLAQSVIVAWGWRRAALAILAGALSVLAFAPVFAFPILWLTFPVLVWLIDGIGAGPRRQRAMSAAWIGWCFGLGFFLASLYWVGEAFLVEAETFAWLLPLGVVILPAGLALFTALGTAIAAWFWSPGAGRIIALATGLTIAEWLRGNVLTGFPWNTLGYALTPFHPLTQTAAIFGAYGLTFFCVIIFAAPATRGEIRPGFASRFALPAAALLLLCGFAAYGIWRVPASAVPVHPDLRLRIVQPAIPQKEKWVAANRSRIFAEYLRLSDMATSPEISGVGDITHVIWPESAPPFLLEQNEEARAAIAALLPPGVTLVTGALRINEADVAPSNGKPPIYNSVLVLNESAHTVASYDKVHLVPFGEYLPMQSLLEAVGLRQLTRIKGGLTAGDRRTTMEVAGLPPFVPLICYEIIFSGDVVDRATRPEWILNLTNDAWFGDSTGPRQHLHQARIRAIEEGLTVVRAANSGISAVIDPYGRSVRSLGLNSRGVLDFSLPKSLPPTVFARYGHIVLLVLITGGLGLAIASASRTAHKLGE